MKVLKTSWTYQGYPCKAVSFRRTEGLSPDFGFVEMDYSVLSSLTIALDKADIPWRPASGAAMACPLSIQAWFKRVGTTVTDGDPRQPAVAPPKGKLGLFGDLVGVTSIDGKARGEQRYTDIYVDDSGIEEVFTNLAQMREHKRGRIRIPITDIRKFYPHYGAAVQRINTHLSSGEPDPYGLKDGKTAWTAVEYIRWLFSQLPGSPVVVNISELLKLKLPPPSDRIHEAEPGGVLSSLSDILEHYRLVPKLTSGNNFAVRKSVV